MSGVIGIDLGTADAIVASVGKGVVDIVRNEVSERKTPCVVGFTDKNRLIGEAAMTSIKSNYKNTCRNPKQLLGRTSIDQDEELIKEKFFQVLLDIVYHI
ncbi:CG4, putative [Perkinsus marinus ATCC 50983]|uniref:CG4, putative n=1 Tax=Perkinsus marinus (strain ATCC 50983 / TXsc) TaxID=423536 RepID=C5LJ17_PERM5|nr:CG4, putative [Perkinsus marinus ATCC 50983]EER03277.1 CG4, putative [Perkinsus marinus ATCC 50983]|eukprot:XP_002771461.1 CG4, putative [Perkinsus marinus ATCC 50983]